MQLQAAHGTPRLSKRLKYRLDQRPSAGQWEDDEPMELSVAVRLGLTGGLSEKSLRTQLRNGNLAAARVGRRIFVTKGALKKLFALREVPRREPPEVPTSDPVSTVGEQAPRSSDQFSIDELFKQELAAPSTRRPRLN